MEKPYCSVGLFLEETAFSYTNVTENVLYYEHESISVLYAYSGLVVRSFFSGSRKYLC